MYHRVLRIVLFGLADDVVTAIKAVQAPPRFTFEFDACETVDLEKARACSVVIATAESLGDVRLEDLSSAAREGKYGYRGLALVVSAEDTAAWTAEDYSLVDALWPAPLSPACAAFEFGHVVERAKHQADSYITGAYLDTLIDSAPEMIWFKAIDGEHVKVNSYFCDIVEKTREDVTGQFHNYIWSVPEEDWEKAELTCKESDEVAIKAGTTTRCDELVSTRGEIRTFDTYKTPIYDEDGTILGTSGFAHDVTVERELQHLAWLTARTDYLTDLFNRRYFYEYLEDHESEGPVTFVLIDLDGFKEINDIAGHDEGDNALLITTGVLHKCFPNCQIVRWGGDEFIVVISQEESRYAEDENIAYFQSTLREWTRQKCPIELTSSIGIATKDASLTVDEAVKHADAALYEAKRTGKSQHLRYEEMQPSC